ncbi:sacsin-like [Limanda limanda]|uniref:sacsin-like n=1 Tax=Limanda limanda TaxID=27771 RepID=UPI0029C9A27C|nr:sacsin-like [Limanda limanda]
MKVITEVNMTLTKEIIALLCTRIEPVHLPVLGQLLMCDSLQEVQKILAKNKIQDSTEIKSLLLTPPAPGTEVPKEWHDSLDMNILNNFEEGEYVGFSTDNKYIYAVIVEELPGNSGQLSRRYKVDIGEEEPIEVSCLDIYQIKQEKKAKPGRTCQSGSCMELEPLAGAVPPHSQSSSTRSLPASVNKAKREIDQCLAEIWTLPAEERHKAIRRLYLRSHPDKNPDHPFLANEAFKYLMSRVEEPSRGKGKTGGSSSSRGHQDFRDSYQQWDKEARYHRSNREGFSGGGFWTNNGNVPQPNKEEAQRWCRQARCDLNAANKDTGGGSTEWCLFKVHQAVEKSLTAAEYKKHGRPLAGSSISALATRVSCYNRQLTNLPQIVQNLQILGVDAKKTQYPNCHRYPHIPNEQFKSENEMQALEKASELLSAVEAYVN